MKKMNSTSKRKWILGGALAFGGIALLTTGFATWIVGVQNTKTEGNVGVTVDTVQDSSVKIEATLSDQEITIADKVTDTDGPAVVVPEGNAEALKITFSSIKVTFGKEYEALSGNITGIKFSLPYAIDEESEIENIRDNANLLASDAANKIGTDRTVEKTQVTNPSGSYWTYLEAPDLLGVASGSKTETSLTYTDAVVEFKYGSFFNHKGPAEFYNEVYASKSVTDQVVTNIKEELNAMTTLFSKGLTLVIELETDKQ